MKYFFSLIFILFYSFSLYSQQQGFAWANQCGNPPNTSDTKSTLASGAGGDFYFSAEFLDTVQFGNKILVSSGGTDIYLVKHSPEGNPLWSIKMGGTDFDYVQDILTDQDDNIIVTGYFYGTTQIGTDQYTSYGSQDIFVAKFDSEGAFQWSYRAGGPMADYISGLSLDEQQNILISGYFYDEISFGDTTIFETGSSDIFLAKFNPGGQLQWIAQAGGSSSDQARSISCDEDGNIILASSFYYDFTIGDTTLTTANPVGIAIARFSTEGIPYLVFQLEGTYLTPEVYTATVQGGEFYLSGNFSEMITFGSKTFDAGEFNQDFFIAKYDDTGKVIWAKHAHSYGSDQVIGMETDNDNNLFLTGHYLDSLHLDLVTLPYTLCCGSREVFIFNIASNADVQWGERIAGTRANIQDLTVTNEGDLLLSGLFSEEINMGPLKLSNFDGFQNYITCLETNTVTFINDFIITENLRIYPNPAGDFITFQDIPGSFDFYYQVFHLNGSLVAAGIVRNGDNILTGNLPAGQYVVQLKGRDNGSLNKGVFIKL